MTANPTLATAVDGIYTAIGTALQAQITTGGKLANLATLTRGDSTGIKPPLPALFYYGGRISQPERNTLAGTREVWKMPVYLVSVARGESGSVGATAANNYALNGRATLLASSGLGLDYVRKIESDSVVLAAPHKEDRSIFGAVALVAIEFTASR